MLNQYENILCGVFEGQSFAKEIQDVFAAKDADIIYNWKNELRQTNKGEKTVAAQSALDLQRRGFSAAEAIELLAADKFGLDVAESAVYEIYGKEQREARKNIVKTAMVVPTSYNDVAPIIEETLSRLSPKEFVHKLARSEMPILRVSSKNIESWYRLATAAKEHGGHAMTILHSELRPWVEETMLKSVLIAEKENASIQRLSSDRKQFRVAMQKESADVDLDMGVSTGTRFQKGNFSDFGLADEFMIQAADHSSPYERLRRALSM